MGFLGLDSLFSASGLSPQEDQYGQALGNAMAGKTPSFAERLLQMQQQRFQQQMSGQAANRQGVGSALALRNAQLAGTQLQSQAQQQAALARAQEQQAALAAYGQYAQNSGDTQRKLGGSFLSALGSVAGLASDERAKTAIQDGGPAADDFMQALQAHTYDYRDPERFGPGRNLGVMAQDVAEVAPGMVAPGPDGTLHIDPARLSGATAAATGRLHDRLQRVEDALGLAPAGAGGAFAGRNVGESGGDFGAALERSRQAAAHKEALMRDINAADATPSGAYGRGTAPGYRERQLAEKARRDRLQRDIAAADATPSSAYGHGTLPGYQAPPQFDVTVGPAVMDSPPFVEALHRSIRRRAR